MKPGGVTPGSQVSAFIARFEPPIARLARASRRELRKRLPTAIELVYDNYNALAIGFSSTARASDCIVSLAVYPRGVNLYFMYGAALPDPSGVLLGKGNRGRFVRLASAGDFDKKEIATLLREATGLADPPLPPNGRGRTIVKSISAKQRARRARRVDS